MIHNSTSGYTPHRVASRPQRDVCVSVFRAALFTIVKMWELPNCPGMNEWMSKVCYIHTTEYHSALKRKEILTHIATWMMNPENIMLSKIGQFQKRQILYDST